MNEKKYTVTIRFDSWSFQIVSAEDQVKLICDNFGKNEPLAIHDENGKSHYINLCNALMMEVSPLEQETVNEADSSNHVDGSDSK